jgi:hypothetical protein
MRIDEFFEKSDSIIKRSMDNLSPSSGDGGSEPLTAYLQGLLDFATHQIHALGKFVDWNAIMLYIECLVKLLIDHVEQIQSKGIHFTIDWSSVLSHIDGLMTLIVEKLPEWEMKALEVFDSLFSPRQWLRQLSIVIAVELMIVGGRALGRLGNVINAVISSKARKQKELLASMANANSYTEWQQLAERIDSIRGFDKWKNRDESSLFDHRVLKKRIHDTEEMIRHGDVFNLIFRLRGGLARDQFGMQHEGLFLRAMSGTKAIVEKYHDTMARALNFICDSHLDEEDVR